MSELIDIVEKIKVARFVFTCGNGGSAATAEHLANDLFKKGKKAICLNSNTSIMTMIANDYGYEYVFQKQLEVFGDYPDLLITISCSGTSSNIIYAQNLADELGMEVYPFEIFDKDQDYGKLENKHLKFVHEIAKQL